MESAKPTERDLLLLEEQILNAHLEVLIDQMAKTMHELAVVRQKLMQTRHMFVISNENE